MSRRGKKSKPHVGISVFSFLDALICTMGALIVLLAIGVQQSTARAYAEVAAAEDVEADSTAEAGKIAKEHTEAIEEIEWHKEVLAKQRDERLEELAKLRQLTAHMEDHLRRLQEQARELLLKAQAIDEGKQLEGAELTAARLELARNKEAIEKAKAEIEKLKKERTEKERWFALIPYDGPNGTRRRPIYIECSEAGIVLQPEGVVLMPDDFNGPLGPGNPLDAALKAKKEYLERNGEKALPYPLLVVRPDGIVAYMVARAALKSWEDEFGYELIDGERKLVYGEPDPLLKKAMSQTVNNARLRQARMVASMPGKYHAKDNLQSFNTTDAMSGSPEMEMTDRGVGASGTAGGGIGGDPRTGGVGTGGTGQGGIGAGQGVNLSGAGQGYSSQPNGQAGQPSGPQNAMRAGSVQNSGTAGGPGGGQYASQPGGNSPTPSGTGANGNTAQQGQGKTSAGGSQWNQVAGNNGSSAGGSSGASGGSGGSSAASGSQSSQSGLNISSMSGAQPSSANQGYAGKPSGPGMPSASRKGINWGLMNHEGHTVAVSRPIRVAVQKSQIVVLPELGEAASPVVIPVPDQELTGLEIDAFVQTIQKRIESWGIAAENGYWRPQLSMDVSANAEGRYQQWEQALAGSGYEVKRKQR